MKTLHNSQKPTTVKHRIMKNALMPKISIDIDKGGNIHKEGMLKSK
jgi:hypothetical protein